MILNKYLRIRSNQTQILLQHWLIKTCTFIYGLWYRDVLPCRQRSFWNEYQCKAWYHHWRNSRHDFPLFSGTNHLQSRSFWLRADLQESLGWILYLARFLNDLYKKKKKDRFIKMVKIEDGFKMFFFVCVNIYCLSIAIPNGKIFQSGLAKTALLRFYWVLNEKCWVNYSYEG